MTPLEVEKAIGVPPGSYAATMPLSSGRFGTHLRESGLPSASLRSDSDLTLEEWIWDDYWIWVVFDKNEKVVGLYLLKSSGPSYSPSLFDRLRQFIGL
jgi:hypothetical protein